jgi:zinicin-like metallopeptidase
VLSLVERLASRWESELEDVEFGTEDVPQIPDTWSDEPVPFGSYVPARPGAPARIVVFRRPIELRAATKEERAALVNEVLVEHIAELLGRDPSEIDP